MTAAVFLRDTYWYVAAGILGAIAWLRHMPTPNGATVVGRARREQAAARAAEVVASVVSILGCASIAAGIGALVPWSNLEGKKPAIVVMVAWSVSNTIGKIWGAFVDRIA
jgi:hypothetical protein